MIEAEVLVVNRLGLHARAAAKLVHLAARFSSRVTLIKEGEEVEGKSILGILLLAASQGTSLRIRCHGDDEEAAVASLSALFARGFEEDV